MLSFALFIVSSMVSFGQTTETSEHPLLDKYYPQPKQPKPAAPVVAPPVTQPQTSPPTPAPATVTAPATPLPAPATVTAPVAHESAPEISSEVKPVTATVPVTETKTTIPPPTPTPIPATPAAIQPQRKPTPIWDTRLGSSSPLYDTYEKNKNGVGSVTTNPK
jgi:hypothetical protein